MNTVRIIGGDWRRRLLRFPDSEGLRPPPDRVRETLFNWLGQDLHGRTCLDLFAGSGALGFEAASRRAQKVVLVEKSARVVAALQENARLLDPEGRLQIVRGDGVQYAASTGLQFDVIFLDPPYNKGWIAQLAPHLGRLLKPDAALYVEAESAMETLGPELAGWRTVRHGKAGEVHFHLMRQESCSAA